MHAPASGLSLRCDVVPEDFSLAETQVLKATFGKDPRDMQWELLFDYLLTYCVPPAALKTLTSEALVKSLEARAVDAGLPGAFPDKLTALDNQHNLHVSLARPIAINKAIYIQTLFRNKPSVKRVKLAEAGKGMLGAAATQSLLSPESAAGLALTHKVQESGPQSVVEQLFVMKAPESTWGTQNLVNPAFNKEQVAANLGINKTDVTFAQQLSRASGVPGAVCPDRGHVLREMQSGLTDAIGEKADTFAEGSSLRIETWPSRAYSASPSVFSAVETCAAKRLRDHSDRSLSRTPPFRNSSAIGEKLDIYGTDWCSTRAAPQMLKHLWGQWKHSISSKTAGNPFLGHYGIQLQF